MATTDRNAPNVTVNELQRQMPASIRKALPQSLWNKGKLWALNITVEAAPVDSLSYLLELPVWQLNGKRFQVKPINVLNDPEKYPDHFRRIIGSDLKYAVHVTKKGGRLTIIDGFHRLAKARMNGDKFIQAKILTDADLDSVSVTSKTL
jgi:hypothetical protein